MFVCAPCAQARALIGAAEERDNTKLRVKQLSD